MTEDVETRVGPRGRWSPTRVAGRLVDRMRPRVAVEVRTYWKWSPEPTPGYRMTVKNLSSRRTIEVDEAWFAPGVPLSPDDSPLPRRIEPRGKWKGWAARTAFEGAPADVGRLGRVRLKTGQEYRSQPARDVPLPDHGPALREAAAGQPAAPGDATGPAR